MSSEINFIKKELQKTGFQLEDKVASTFYRLKNFDVEPNFYFTDWQSGDNRELDIRASYQVTPPPVRIEYIFLIECKSLPGHAWIFIRSQGEQILFKDATSMWDNVGKLGRQEPVVEILEPTLKVDHLEDETFSDRYKEIILDKQKSNKRDDNILSSSVKLAKAMYFEQKRGKKINAILRRTIKKEIDHIRIYYPLVIFEGKMYEAIMLPKISLRPISSAHLHNFSIQNGKEIDMIIDVVKTDILKDFIQKRFLVEASQVKNKEAKKRHSHLSLIKKIRFKKKIVTSLEMLADFMKM